MNLGDIHKIYFIGIGGIGMSAIARYFYTHGAEVSGYDKTPNEVTEALQEQGIEIHFEENPDQIPKDVDVVVYTPAVPKNHKELIYYQEHGYTVLKRSEILHLISKGAFTVAVAGTHGKTTTSTMIAHLLHDSGKGCSAFLGGISQNYGTNFFGDREDLIVAEADEFDRSFLRLDPNIAIITAVDADHLDIYGDDQELQRSFYDFTQKLAPDGHLIIKHGLPMVQQVQNRQLITYGLEDSAADARAENIRVEDGAFHFDYHFGDVSIKEVELNYPGIHNVENTVAAITVALLLEIEIEKIRTAVSGFKGIHRRFEYVIRRDDLVFIDDYAHHPQEIKALLRSVRMMYPGRKITAVFQPHLYSRTRDFVDDFAEELSRADEVLLLPIYPAREEPIPGVESEMILERMKGVDVQVVQKSDLVDTLKKRQVEVLLTVGAGDIDRLVNPIKKALI